MRSFSQREKLILAGLYLSKFDVDGLDKLGFSSFTEAFNAFALSLKSRPASLKNYRDEFDPYFPNPRRGWHKRPFRKYCEALYTEFGQLDLKDFTHLLEPLISGMPSVEGLDDFAVESTAADEPSSFAKRLITGAAAEGYFEQVFSQIEEFRDCEYTDTTRVGCGFDFKIDVPRTADYYAVEVKGLSGSCGSVALTEKEHQVAGHLGRRYFLFVARNFADRPFHTIYRDPLRGGLTITCKTRIVRVTDWQIPITN